MINRQTLLSDLQKLLQKLEVDLLERSMSAEVPEVGVRLKEEHERATKAQRTAQNYEDWRTDAMTQAAAAWVLSCVFVRFLEDNRLIDPPKISGPASGSIGQSEDRLGRARDEHELYFRKHPKQTDREYLLSIFDQLAKLPGTKDVFGEHNPIRELPNWLSGDAAGELLKFFQKIDANTGALVHDFTDSNWDTRFLGDLYQDLSEAARKKYALLQTPDFVEVFILDRTLDPALDEFGLEPRREGEAPVEPRGSTDLAAASPSRFKMIDPACGSGHFLLGSFPRILDRWMKKEPGTNVRELVQRTLDSIHGVDVNPFAIAIARFRLLLAALRACGIRRLADAPAFRLNLVCGDSLLHAPLSSGQKVLDFELTEDSDECDHAYRSENLAELKRVLRGGQYHAVVGNPPYIVPKDKQLNERYRRRFLSCHRQYSLAVPFLERIFRLAVAGGYTGQITTNTFMKAEFGKKLIELFFPNVDLTHVIDTAGAYIPGHGTPTVILFGRHRLPVSSTLRTVLGIRGEPATPADPASGLVWSEIVSQLDQPGSESSFVSVGDSLRGLFHKHPWSIGGGGASELKSRLEGEHGTTLGEIASAIGRTTVVGEDDAWICDFATGNRRGLGAYVIPLCVGDGVRDWALFDLPAVIYPYLTLGGEAVGPDEHRLIRALWPSRAILSARSVFGKSLAAMGRPWWEHLEHYRDKLRTPLSIAYAFVATHNHFALDRGGKVFKQTAPVIKMQRENSEDEHVALLGLLNSSTVCFWMKQVCFPKGGDTVGGEGARVRQTLWDIFFNFNSTPLGRLPLAAGKPSATAKRLDMLAQQSAALAPINTLCRARLTSRPSLGHSLSDATKAPLPDDQESLLESIGTARQKAERTHSQMIAAQEELDWECYRLYRLIADNLSMPVPPPIMLGQRAFEIVLARKLAAGETQTTWFERHGSTPITELPAEWPDDYRQLVERRIELIESDPNIRLIEQPEYKRRWNTEPWESQLERALREWLLNRLEGYFDFDGRMRDIHHGVHGEHGGNAEENSSTQCDSSSVNSVASVVQIAFPEIQLVSIARLATVAGQDADFLQVGELYRNDPAFDVQALVTELVAPECVPLLPVLRYKPAGLIKRTTWERTWDLQRQEDTIDARTQLPATDPNSLTEDAAKDLKQKQVGKIPVPTKYDSKDFLTSDFWRLRGKLDVPKERWISFPHCDGPDGTMMLCWAGYDHLQQARAISAYYVQVQTEFGGTDDPRLIPLLACLIELLPWLKQWHNDLDPEFNMSMGDYFEGFINEEARQLGKTLQEIREWTPPAKTAARRSRRSK